VVEIHGAVLREDEMAENEAREKRARGDRAPVELLEFHNK
jgi:hypothetical protein